MLDPQTYQLRDYQVAAINGVCEHWRKGSRRVMLQMPTGAGKTCTFSDIAREFTSRSEPVLVLAHREELVTQAADKLMAIANVPIGIIKSGYRPNYAAPIQVASVQSLVNRLDRLQPPSLTVIDEAHHSTAKTYRHVLDAFPEACQLGVTATPIRTDGTGFDDLFDALVCGPTVRELIDDGHLSPFQLFADPNPMATKGARTRQGDWSTGDIADLNPVIELSGSLITSYSKHCPGKRCVVFAVNVEHSQAIAGRYNQAGIPAAHLDGTTSSEERRTTLEQFAAGKLQVLSNCQLFTEGFDLPALDAVQIARPTKSLALWLQMVGRALRTSPGKECAILLDHTKNWAIHGLPTRPRSWTLTGVKSEPRKIRADARGRVTEAEPKPPLEIQETGVDLKAVDTSDEADWYREWERLVFIQGLRGYQPTWLAYQLREIKPPLEIWKACGRHLRYKPGWAWHQWREYSQGKKPQLPEYKHKPANHLQQTWQQVTSVVKPLGTRALLQAQGILLNLDGEHACVGIKSRPLLKMAQSRTQNLEQAFAEVLNHPIRVSMEAIAS